MEGSKGAKAALKEARHAIDQKDYKAALKACKKALTMDRDNYLALVFSGLCLFELGKVNDAIKSYQLAVSKEPSQTVAWQGIISMYEKLIPKAGGEKYLPELEKTYRSLAKVHEEQGDLEKYISITDKLSNHLMQVSPESKLDDVISILLKQIEVSESADSLKARQVRGNLIRLLSGQENLSDRHLQLLTSTLSLTITDDQTIQNMDLFKLNLKHLYKLRMMEELLDCAVRMHRTFPGNAHALEWICKVVLEWAADTLSFKSRPDLRKEAGEYAEKLLKLNPNSVLGNLCLGAMLWKNGVDLLKARQILQTTLDSSSNVNFYGSYILCNCLMSLKAYLEAEAYIEKAMFLLPKVKEDDTREEMRSRLNCMLVDALYSQFTDPKMKKANKVLNEMDAATLGDDLKLISCKIRAALREYDTLARDLKELQSVASVEAELVYVQAMIKYGQDQLEEATKLVDSVLDQAPEHFESLLLKGMMEYKHGSYSKSLAWFLRMAKANPSCPTPFLYLGHVYSRSGDLEKARKCYQKSFQLDPSLGEAGTALSDTYSKLGETDKNLEFLESVTGHEDSARLSPSLTWAYLRLGMLQMDHYEESSMAIKNLQNAVRSSNGEHVEAWECLADAYKGRGSYNAALKAFEEVLKLRQHNVDESIYAHYQIGCIKKMLGQHREAVTAFDDLLSLDGDYVPALVGLGDTLVHYTKQLLDEGLDLNAVSSCSRAIDVLTKAARSRPDVRCIWKLLGDALTVLHVLPIKTLEKVNFSVPSILIHDASCEADYKPVKSIVEMLALGSRCYLRSLHLRKKADKEDMSEFNDIHVQASLWFDLAFNFLVRWQHDKEDRLLQTARHAVERAISFDSSNADFWNLLGIVCLHSDEFPLAQHAFIKAVRSNNNAAAWTNLGVMYHIIGESKLANQCFKEAQDQDPSYIKAWVGQALLAEQTKFKHHEEEAMDLFRHTTLLGNELESAVGYANWVCRTLVNMGTKEVTESSHSRYCIERMYGVSVALDSLSRYCLRDCEDPCALNMLGLIQEREGLKRSSKQSFEAALQNLVDQGQHRENHADLVRKNLGRVCIKLGLYEQAIKNLTAISKPNFSMICALATAYYRGDHFETSYRMYQKALQDKAMTGRTSEVLAAMAAIAYRFQGPDACKTLLFQSCQCKPVSARGLFALCVLGLKQKDATLANAACKAMAEYNDSSEHGADVAYLRALVDVRFGNGVVAALRRISNHAHKYPYWQELWNVVADFILTFAHELPNESASLGGWRCAVKSAVMAQSKRATSSKSSSNSASSGPSSSQLTTLCLLMAKKKLRGQEKWHSSLMDRVLRSAASQNAHLFPEKLSSWHLMAAAVNSDNRQHYVRIKAKTALLDEDEYGKSSDNIEQWLRQEVSHCEE